MSQHTESHTEPKHWFHTPYKTNEQFTIGKAILIYLIYAILPAFMIGFIFIILQGFGVQTINLANFSMLSVIAAYTITLLLYHPIFKVSPLDMLKKMDKQALLLAIKLYAILMVGNVVLNLIPSPIPENQQILQDTMDAGNPLLFGLFTVLLAPLIEELLFRQVFFRAFSKADAKTGKWLFILNIILFTFLHTGGAIFANPIGTLQYAWLSFIFTYAYAKTRRLQTPLALHMINNGVAYVAILLTQYVM